MDRRQSPRSAPRSSQNRPKQKKGRGSERAQELQTHETAAERIRHQAVLPQERDPIYFISATNFNLLGAEEWVKGFKFICYMDCFDRQYPNVVVPNEMSARRAWPRREA